MTDTTAARATPLTTVLRTSNGDLLPMHTARWSAEANSHEATLLRSLRGPVLDIGCGPGRLVAGLLRMGTPALGLDPAPRAVALAQRRGALVLQRSIWDPLPGEGRWSSVLLFDGNIGIGGDPAALLSRCRELLASGGQVLLEVGGPEAASSRFDARLERAGRIGGWFRWATVGVDDIHEVAGAAALEVERLGHATDGPGPTRWFAWLRSG